MSLRAVLFDLDGTLHNKSATLRAVGAAQYQWAGLRALGIAAAHWESEYLVLNNQLIEKAEVFARLRSTFGLPKSVAAALLEDYDNNLGKSAILYAGAVDLLAACGAKGLKLGIITNGRDAFQRSKINGMGIANLESGPQMPPSSATTSQQIWSRPSPSECMRSGSPLLPRQKLHFAAII